MKKGLVILLLITVFQSVIAVNYKPLLYKAYVKGEMALFEEVLEGMKVEYATSNSETLQRDIIKAQYCMVSFYLGSDNNKSAYVVIKDAERRINQLLAKDKDDASMLAIRASFTGFRIILNPVSTLFLGGKLLSDMNRCKNLDFTNTDVLFLHSNSTYYAPKFLGGSKEKGLDNYKKLRLKLEKSEISKAYDYFALMCLTANGIALVDAEKYNQAADLYKYVLKVEPGYDWVRNDLLPKAISHKNSQHFDAKRSDKKYQ